MDTTHTPRARAEPASPPMPSAHRTGASTRVRLLIAGVLGAIGLCPGLAGCAATPTGGAETTTIQTLNEVADWMTGSYANTIQATEHPESIYEQHLHIVRIWLDRTDGPWLYVEQELARRPDAPFRQRVERLRGAPDGSVLIEMFALDDPLVFAGAWERADPLGELTPGDLIPIPGCAVVLSRTGPGVYEGATIGRGCASTRLGAVYASSAMRLTPRVLEIWDRGFDEQGRQVWGSLTSGFVFDKILD